MTYSCNITIKELQDAINFARENNRELITIHFDPTPIGKVISVSQTFDSDKIDISNYDVW